LLDMLIINTIIHLIVLTLNLIIRS